MKRFVAFAAALCVCGPVLTGTSLADQTDPALETLFSDLRTGTPLDADGLAAGIVDIWTDAASDTVDVLYARAEEAAANDATALALELLDHVVGLAPQFAQGYALRARLRRSEGAPEKAIEDYEQALRLEPRHFLVRYELGTMLEDSRAYRDAFDMYQSALQWNPHFEPARRRADQLRRKIEGQEI